MIKQPKQRHTSGPWVAHRLGAKDTWAPWAISDGRGNTLATVEGMGATNGANATLIAMAPELLDALKETAGWLASAENDGDRERARELGALIAKVEGRAI